MRLFEINREGELMSSGPFSPSFGTFRPRAKPSLPSFRPSLSEAFTDERTRVLMTPIEAELIVRAWIGVLHECRITGQAADDGARTDVNVEPLRFAAEGRIDELVRVGAVSLARVEAISSECVSSGGSVNGPQF